jgi:hypothetical protein
MNTRRSSPVDDPTASLSPEAVQIATLWSLLSPKHRRMYHRMMGWTWAEEIKSPTVSEMYTNMPAR